MFGIDHPDISLDKLTSDIKQAEGTGPVKNGRFMPYTDTTGNLTIGNGINLSAGITDAENTYLLGNRIRFAIGEAEAQPWWDHVKDNDARARGFIEIIFNIGLGGLGTFREGLDAAMRDDWAGCSAAFLDSLWHRQVGARAERICNMILTGEDPAVS